MDNNLRAYCFNWYYHDGFFEIAVLAAKPFTVMMLRSISYDVSQGRDSCDFEVWYGATEHEPDVKPVS